MSEYFECENIKCMAYFEGHCLWKKTDKDKIDLSDKNTCPRIIEQLKEQIKMECKDCKYSCGCIETCKIKSSECYQNKQIK